MAKTKKAGDTVLARTWNIGGSCLPLMGVQTGTATLKNSWALSWKADILHSPASYTYLSGNVQKNVCGSLMGNNKKQTKKGTIKHTNIQKLENEWTKGEIIINWTLYNTENIVTVYISMGGSLKHIVKWKNKLQKNMNILLKIVVILVKFINKQNFKNRLLGIMHVMLKE